jgi:hypothetical protein
MTFLYGDIMLVKADDLYVAAEKANDFWGMFIARAAGAGLLIKLLKRGRASD